MIKNIVITDTYSTEATADMQNAKSKIVDDVRAQIEAAIPELVFLQSTVPTASASAQTIIINYTTPWLNTSDNYNLAISLIFGAFSSANTLNISFTLQSAPGTGSFALIPSATIASWAANPQSINVDFAAQIYVTDSYYGFSPIRNMATPTALNMAFHNTMGIIKYINIATNEVRWACIASGTTYNPIQNIVASALTTIGFPNNRGGNWYSTETSQIGLFDSNIIVYSLANDFTSQSQYYTPLDNNLKLVSSPNPVPSLGTRYSAADTENPPNALGEFVAVGLMQNKLLLVKTDI